MLLGRISVQEHPARGPQAHRRILAAPFVLGHRSFDDAEPVNLYLQAGRYALHRGDGIFEGRAGMDHGKGTGGVPALADEVISVQGRGGFWNANKSMKGTAHVGSK